MEEEPKNEKKLVYSVGIILKTGKIVK